MVDANAAGDADPRVRPPCTIDDHMSPSQSRCRGTDQYRTSASSPAGLVPALRAAGEPFRNSGVSLHHSVSTDPILSSSMMKDRKRSGWFDKPTRQDDWRALGVFLGLEILVFAYAFLVSVGGLAVALVASLCCICVLTAQLWRSTGRQGQTRAVGNRVRPPVQPPRPRPSSPWPAAKRRFAELQRSYAGYECDPMAVLRLPALADVTVPSTARFINALATAQALDSDHEPPATHQQAYVAAVDHAHRAWTAARAAAERIRLCHLTPAEVHGGSCDQAADHHQRDPQRRRAELCLRAGPADAGYAGTRQSL